MMKSLCLLLTFTMLIYGCARQEILTRQDPLAELLAHQDISNYSAKVVENAGRYCYVHKEYQYSIKDGKLVFFEGLVEQTGPCQQYHCYVQNSTTVHECECEYIYGESVDIRTVENKECNSTNVVFKPFVDLKYVMDVAQNYSSFVQNGSCFSSKKYKFCFINQSIVEFTDFTTFKVMEYSSSPRVWTRQTEYQQIVRKNWTEELQTQKKSMNS